MKNHLDKLKSELKVLANEIKELKKTRKSCPYGYVPGLQTAQYDFRVKHIVRCMLRGRSIDEIEPSVRDPNCSNLYRVRRETKKMLDQILAEVEKSNEQTLCTATN